MEEVTTMEQLERLSQAIGPRVRIARENAGLTQEELAGRVGVSVSSIQAWEADERAPRGNRLVSLAGVLGVPLTWLLEGREDEYMESDDAASLATTRAELDRIHALLSEALSLVATAREGVYAMEERGKSADRDNAG